MRSRNARNVFGDIGSPCPGWNHTYRTMGRKQQLKTKYF